LTGRAGLKLVDEGNLIQSSDTTGIVVITQEQPMSVLFSVPEDNIPQVERAIGRGGDLAVVAYDRAGNTPIATGKLAAVDNQIDTTTGTVKLRALFANENHELFPNQFVNIRLMLGMIPGATLIPNSAIQIGAQTNSVFVVKSDNTVEQRTVKLGRSEDERTAIQSGLEVGEIVAIDGLDKLQDGATVVPHAHTAADSKADATPPQNGARQHRQHNGQGGGQGGWQGGGQGGWKGGAGGQNGQGGQDGQPKQGAQGGQPNP
jgi:multidrug efflux system membrane fusion protein